MRSDDRRPTAPRQLTPRELTVLDTLDSMTDEQIDWLAELLRLSIERDRQIAAAHLSRKSMH